jgi:hypothetical protein
MCLHELGALVAEVVLVRGSVMVPAFCQDKDVVALPEGVGVDGTGAEVDVGVLARRLGGGTPVEVPDG